MGSGSEDELTEKEEHEQEPKVLTSVVRKEDIKNSQLLGRT